MLYRHKEIPKIRLKNKTTKDKLTFIHQNLTSITAYWLEIEVFFPTNNDIFQQYLMPFTIQCYRQTSVFPTEHLRFLFQVANCQIPWRQTKCFTSTTHFFPSRWVRGDCWGPHERSQTKLSGFCLWFKQQFGFLRAHTLFRQMFQSL